MKRLWCWLRYGHCPREFLANVMCGYQPHSYYHCKNCGAYFTEPWDE